MYVLEHKLLNHLLAFVPRISEGEMPSNFLFYLMLKSHILQQRLVFVFNNYFHCCDTDQRSLAVIIWKVNLAHSRKGSCYGIKMISLKSQFVYNIGQYVQGIREILFLFNTYNVYKDYFYMASRLDKKFISPLKQPYHSNLRLIFFKLHMREQSFFRIQTLVQVAP